MIIRGKAPLRLGLAGGGTDVASYSDLFGEAILNITINNHAHATIEPTGEGMVSFFRAETVESVSFPALDAHPTDHAFILHAGVYCRVVSDLRHQPLSCRLTTQVDAPAGSGLGSSSTLAVAMLGTFSEWMKLPLGKYDLAHLAYEIERSDLGMAGSRQVHYSATFGGVNFMKFCQGNKVIVNPLPIRQAYLNELAHNLVLYDTGTSHISAVIIENQQKNVSPGKQVCIEAMHQIKHQAVMMKEDLLRGEIDRIGEILDYGWKHKKMIAEGITNAHIDIIVDTASQYGASGDKISVAGGGGFMMFYCPVSRRASVIKALQPFGGQVKPYEFTNHGVTTWII